jgi:iron complex outermembrane receptor protein
VKKLILLCSTAIALPTAAFAQSTGSQDFENEAIIVTGTRTQEVGGVQAPDTAKAKAVLTQEMIGRQNPGQTILDTINLVPGVSFQNNDAYGSGGGTLTIRGFAGDRISLTFDGVPLNDSGNYAIYSNQQLDPELIEQVNVNLGTTDVDSPTAAAVGGTVNYRTRLPSTKFGVRAVGSLGQFDFRRIFAVVDTGEIGPWGTRAYVSVSNAKNDNPFNNYGKVDKQQYNAKIYQPIGTNGDFVAVSGHYNQNRNNFFGSVSLRNDRAVPGGFPQSRDDREYDLPEVSGGGFPCQVAAAVPGVADDNNNCGTEFDRRYNPSNTGNIRGQSRFTLMDNLTLTVDPSYQYVKANGGGTDRAREYGRDINPAGGNSNCSTAAPSPNLVCAPGYFAGDPYFGGVDLNGDGDVLDIVSILTPSQTRTHRVGVIAGLRYDINDDHIVRVSYTFDRANHRQTGETGLLKLSGEPYDVFPVNDELHDGLGFPMQKRDRQSYATLHQIAGEWIGSFMQDRLTVNVGARLPFFKRDLENYCATSSTSGFVECSGQNPTTDELAGDLNPTWQPPQRRVLKYDKLLPNIGAVFDVTQRISVFGNYAKGLSVPGTDSLYDSFGFAPDDAGAHPNPEITDTFDAGLRYRSSKVQAQLSWWYTKFTNRLASAYDPETDQTVFRNLGRVDKWGIDGSVAYSPIRALTLYAWGSWKDVEIKDNIQIDNVGGPGFDCDDADPTSVIGIKNCAFTKGNEEAGSPKYTYGLSALASLGDFDFGITAKRTGPRYIYDSNTPVFSGDVDNLGDLNPANDPVQIFGSKAPAYWLVNLDARFNLRMLRGLEKSYFSLNVYNLFDKLYVGGFTAGLNQGLNSSGVYASAPNAQIGAPRTVSGTLSIQF